MIFNRFVSSNCTHGLYFLIGYSSGTPAAVDPRVTQVEDKLVGHQKQRFTLPPRPDYGTKGTLTCVRANYFPVVVPTRTLYKYDVAMSPDPKVKRIRSRIYKLLEDSAFKETKHLMATDYGKTFITAERLKLTNDRLQVEVRYYDVEQQAPDEKSKVYVCTISLVQQIEPDQLQDFVDGKTPDFDPSCVIQALNIILAKPPSQDPGLVPGKSKFFISEPKPSMNLGRGLVAFQGYYSSIRPSVGRVLCNVNVCYTAFYKYGLEPYLSVAL